MELVIRINLDNDAFQPNPAPECARILEGLAKRIRGEGLVGTRALLTKLRDINGNTVGVAGVNND